MHEVSICEGIRRIVEEAAASPDISRVSRVRLEIGSFAAVETAALEFAWAVVMRGSKAEGSEVEIIELPGTALCLDCGRTVRIGRRLDPCPDCGGSRLLPEGGSEMRVRDMEVQ